MAVAAPVPTEITDPINARILAVSEDRIAGFLIDPFAEIARLAERRRRDGARAPARDARRRNDSAHSADADGDEPRAGRARRVAHRRATSSTPRFDFLWKRRSVLRPRRDPLDRRRDAGLGVSAVDDAQGAAGILDDASTAICSRAHRRRRVSHHAGEAAVRARRRPRAASRDGARAARPTSSGQVIDTNIVELSDARMARARAAQARVRGRRDRRRAVARRAPRRRACRSTSSCASRGR